jgi:hypothetical protein
MLGSPRTIVTTLVPAGLLLATALTVLAPGAATADSPTETGCPSNGHDGGWQLISTSELIARGYKPHDDLDVNADGYICVKPVSEALQDKVCAAQPGGVCTVPIIYYFTDNDRSSSH